MCHFTTEYREEKIAMLTLIAVLLCGVLVASAVGIYLAKQGHIETSTTILAAGWVLAALSSVVAYEFGHENARGQPYVYANLPQKQDWQLEQQLEIRGRKYAILSKGDALIFCQPDIAETQPAE